MARIVIASKTTTALRFERSYSSDVLDFFFFLLAILCNYIYSENQVFFGRESETKKKYCSAEIFALF